MPTSKRLVFFGNERLVSGLKHCDTPVLTGLIDRGYDIAAVVVNHTDTVSRNARELEVKAVAEAHGIPVLSPHKPTDIVNELAQLGADAAVLSAYGRILPERIINVFKPVGIVNIHPSLLPRHRGPTPIETTILSGDTEAGVSIMQLSPGMDDGPLYGQFRVAVAPRATKFELYEQLSTAGAELLFSLLPNILNGTLQPTPQENNDVSFTSLISKQHAYMSPLTEDATTIERKVRAYLSFPKTKLTYQNNVVIVTSATVVESPEKSSLCIACAHNTWLRIDELIAPSGRRMTSQAFLNGLRSHRS
ncbi:MAG: methionyl-tRNA formyltransferase [Acidobacteriota bacterium]